MRQNPAQQLLTRLLETFSHDEWFTIGTNGFHWYAGRLRHEVSIRSHGVINGQQISELRASTVVVEGVPDAQATYDLLANTNTAATFESLVYNRASKTVVSTFSVILTTENTNWLFPMVAMAIRSKAVIDENRADLLAVYLNGDVARRSHPKRGEREDVDELVHETHGYSWLHAETNDDEELWSQAQRTLMNVIRGSLATAGGSGVTIEIPLAGGKPAFVATVERTAPETGLILLTTRPVEPWFPESAAALRVGPGVTIFGMLPTAPKGDPARACNTFNSARYDKTLPTLWGSWALFDDGPRYTMHVPAIAMPHSRADAATVCVNLALYAAGRLRGASGLLS